MFMVKYKYVHTVADTLHHAVTKGALCKRAERQHLIKNKIFYKLIVPRLNISVYCLIPTFVLYFIQNFERKMCNEHK